MEILVLILIFSLFFFIIILFLSYTFLPIIFWGPIFVPTSKENIKKAIKLIKLKKGQKIADLGCGDGRILIICAQKGAKAIGFEINPFLVLRANLKIKKEKLENLAKAKWSNFWQEDLSDFDVIFIYGISHMMKALEKKLKRELKSKAKVVSFGFKFPHWKAKIEKEGIYIYEKENCPFS